MVLVPRLVGQTQSSIDKKAPGNVRWSIDKLKTAYVDLSEHELGRRLQRILDWAVDKKYFMPAIAMFPCFGLQGKSNSRIVSFSSGGDVYCLLNAKYYPGGVEERDELISQLKALQLINHNLDPQQVVSGRNLAKKLFILTDDELDKLLDVFSKYCI